MLTSFVKATTVFGLLTFGTLSGSSHYNPLRREVPQSSSYQHILTIRVSQETSPGAGNFDSNILGFTSALQTTGTAADFYMYRKVGESYGNSKPALKSNTSHIFFVNAADGLALFVVHNKPNHVESSTYGVAETEFDLSGGTARILQGDEPEDEVFANAAGTVFTTKQDWSSNNTDGMVIGALPVGFTVLGQFTAPPNGLTAWEAISADGSTIQLRLVPGQRVRLDVAPLAVQVQQDH